MPVANPYAPLPGVERAVQRQERERHPHGPLQLHVHEVLEPVRGEREDDPGENAGGPAAGEVAREREHRDARSADRAEQHQVVDEDRPQAGPHQRRRDQPFQRASRRNRPAFAAGDKRCWRRTGASAEVASAWANQCSRHMLKYTSWCGVACDPRYRACGQVAATVRRTKSPLTREALRYAACRHLGVIPISCIRRSAFVDVARPGRRR